MDVEVALRRIDSMTPEELDSLPFGIIKLDGEGVILEYNTYESELARLPKQDVIGKNFFTEIAPCTDVQEFHGRFREGVAARSLNVKFRYVFTFKHNPRDVLVTLFYSEATDSVWVLVQPID